MVYQPKNNYAWREGFQPKVKPNIVGGIFEHLEAENGAITNKAFLDYSRDEDSETHCLFEWDDAKAGELYRLSTATSIINQLQIVYVEKEDSEPQKYMAFVNVDSERDAKYVNIATALSERESKDLVISRIKRDLESMKKKYRSFKEFADLLEECAKEIRKGA